MSLRLGFECLRFLFHNVNTTSRLTKNVLLSRSSFKKSTLSQVSSLHTSSVRQDLMEFFDDKDNWRENEVQCGRSWKVEELRIKSNSDLHKLWYVLLKERNMLLTMQHHYQSNFELMPSPERIDKVEESMENLETVVRERNRAYYELETGETGERPSGVNTNCFGLPFKFKKHEHLIERKFNKRFLEAYKLNNVSTDYKFINEFLMKLEEKKRRRKLYLNRQAYRAVCNILKIFPHVSEEALKEKFPDVDIQKAKEDKMSRGHRENNY